MKSGVGHERSFQRKVNQTTEPRTPGATRGEDSIYGAGPDTFQAKNRVSLQANTLTGASAE